MTGRRIIIFGTGELAEVAEFYFSQDTGREIAAFTIDGANLTETRFCGKPVVAVEDLSNIGPDLHDCFVAVGYSRVNGLREEKCLQLKRLGYSLTSYVSPKATIFSNVEIGWNAFILEDNTIQPFVRVGNGVTLWSGNHIGHHAVIEDFAFISSHVVISGGVKVGARTFIGVNSTVNDHLDIGARCVIGSSSLITQDLSDESVTSAVPAKLSPVPSSRLRGF